MQTYFDRLSQVCEEIELRMSQAQAVPAQPVELLEPVNYEQTYQKHFLLVSLKSKPTKKMFHVSIYRMASGRYELTSYIL